MSAARRIAAIGVMLVLTGCSGTDSDGSKAPPSSSESVVSGTPEPTGEGTAAPSGVTPSGPQFSAAQLEAVLAKINEAESLKATVIPDEDIRNQLEEEPGPDSGLVVTPKECNLYAETSPEALADEATLAVMTFAGESSLQPDSITLSSLPTEDSARRQLGEARGQLAACAEFTFQAGGQDVEAAVEELDVETSAEDHLALRTTVRIPGSIQESVTVTGVVSSTVINVLVGSSTDPEADNARAVELLNLVVAGLERL
ncbi:hypothetical protein GC088_05605 [Arthrobacter sp. JZ12]|uniref:hypothetical protein n=1 Tax=Arthrobacter sp. JZ12 TaxID=2654190 RepID=UPI002B492D31|nr:hypothetical protein [Arthrobacter sp. JZ12]WRH24597.1 hypothetical protein GC088_05605 [Arthrobacter sp. JZ12]